MFGFRWALRIARERGFSQVLFENDCLLLYKAWCVKLNNPSYLSSLVQDCLQLATGFSGCKFVFAKRCHNVVVDFLAKRLLVVNPNCELRDTLWISFLFCTWIISLLIE